MMIATYKILSAALSYPTSEFQHASAELIAALDVEDLLAAAHRREVSTLIRDIAQDDLLDAQSRYVELFDRTKSLSLHLFEHVHGESRDRGQAMVSLLERYQQAGLDVSGSELPDFIPLFLEFLSTLPVAEARVMLAEPAHILAALGQRLQQRNSKYAAVLDALLALSENAPSAEVLQQLREETLEDPADLVALDKAWEESEVRFGPGDAAAGGCSGGSDVQKKNTSTETLVFKTMPKVHQ